MSTYAIADAINKFAENFKYIMVEKNKIDRERLEFEREKFEFNKRQLDLSKPDNKSNTDKVRCNHDWIYECSVADFFGRREHHRCKLCGELKVIEAQMVEI